MHNPPAFIHIHLPITCHPERSLSSGKAGRKQAKDLCIPFAASSLLPMNRQIYKWVSVPVILVLRNAQPKTTLESGSRITAKSRSARTAGQS